MVEVAKKKEAPKPKFWNEKCEDAFQKFLGQAGWANTPEDKQKELAGIDTKIQALEAQIERLNASKLVFDKREEMVKDLIRVAWGALEDDSTLESLLSLAKTKFKIKAKRSPSASTAKKKTGSGRGKIDEKLLQKLLDVLDADGKTVTQLAKEIGEGTDTKELSKLLQKLIAAERVGAEGERRSKKYFLYADGDDEEEDEPEEDEDDEEEDELDEDEEDIEEVAGEEED